jgi:sporulation protein YlmC with PRC-barrel domain
MKKFTTLVAMAALAATLTIPILAVASENDGSQIVLADHSMRTSKLIGAKVYNNQGQSIGSVMEVLVKNGAVEPTVVLSVGDYLGGGAKMVAVPLSHINLDGAKPMMAGATKQMLAKMPVFIFPPDMNARG